MRSLRKLLPLALLVFTLVGAGSVAVLLYSSHSASAADAAPKIPPVPRHPFVYPPQNLDIIFDHSEHAEDERDCADCHEPSDDNATRMTLPTHEQCMECHDIDEAEAGEDTDPPAKCSTCHAGPITRETKLARPLVDIPQSRLVFAHDKHIEAKVSCNECHAGVMDAKLATVEHLPLITTCTNCHERKKVANDCVTCHVGDGKGRIATRAGDLEFKPTRATSVDRHTGDWLKRHAKVANANTKSCLSCHTEKQCSDCHGMRNVMSVHPAGWMASHPARAEMQEFRCQSCHAADSFCSDCHEKSSLRRPNSDLAALGVGSYHPVGWMDPAAGIKSHGPQARMQINTCTTCHEENSCVACHGSSSQGRFGGVSPHPAGFSKKNLLRAAPSSCKGCHLPNDPNIK